MKGRKEGGEGHGDAISRTRDRERPGRKWRRSRRSGGPSLSFILSSGLGFIRPDDQPAIGPTSNARIFIRFLASSSVPDGRNTARHRSHQSSTIPFGRPESLRSKEILETIVRRLFPCDRSLCSRRERREGYVPDATIRFSLHYATKSSPSFAGFSFASSVALDDSRDGSARNARLR